MKLEQRKEDLLVHFSRMVAFNVLSRENNAALVLMEYGRHKDLANDIIKSFLGKLKENTEDYVNSPWEDAILGAVEKQYEVYVKTTSKRLKEAEFIRFKDLSYRLAMTFGIGNVRLRNQLKSLIEKGVEYAFQDPPSKLMFLDGFRYFITAFAPRKADLKKPILDYIKEQGDKAELEPSKTDGRYEPYYRFLVTVRNKGQGVEPPSPDSSVDEGGQDKDDNGGEGTSSGGGKRKRGTVEVVRIPARPPAEAGDGEEDEEEQVRVAREGGPAIKETEEATGEGDKEASFDI